MIPQGLTHNLLSCRASYSLKEKKIFHLLWKMPLNENKVFRFSHTDL